MPRRRPSFLPLLFAAVLLTLVTAVRQSVAVESPPDVPHATIALDDSQQPESQDIQDVIAPPATLSSLSPMMLSPDMTSEEMFSPDMMQPAIMQTTCPEPVGPLRAIWNLPVRMIDWVFHPPRRHRDMGGPLTRESWRYRPFGLGLFVGYINGGTLVDNWTGSSGGVFDGIRLSWDPGYYWGCEFRYATGSLGQWDSLLAQRTLQAADGKYNSHRDVKMDLWDFSLLYYPWGDAIWRPYALAGLGGSKLRFDDCMSEHWSQQVFAMPLALGLKYRYNSRLAFRFELADNIVFGTGRVDTVHHFSVTGGVELRFGGHRKAYWPWNPGRYYW